MSDRESLVGTAIVPARQRGGGFTLVELLIVVGIIAVLIAILLPALNKARASAQAVTCMSNLRQVGLAMHMYANEHKGWFPARESVENNTAYGKLALYWTDTLMEGKYLRIGERSKQYATWPGSGSLQIRCQSELPWTNAISCPSLEPPVTQSAIIGSVTGASSLSTYGMRAQALDSRFPGSGRTEQWYFAAGQPVVNGQPHPYSGVTRTQDQFRDGRMTRAAKVAPDTPLLGDTVGVTSWRMTGRQSNQFSADGFTTSGSFLHRRHNNRANLWFPGGHVQAMDKKEISGTDYHPSRGDWSIASFP